MKLATIRTAHGQVAVRVDGGEAVELPWATDVNQLLLAHDWRERASSGEGARHAVSELDYAPVVPRPSKIFCVGLNYRSHIEEVGLELPEYPTLFAKFADSLLGAYDDLVLPRVSAQVDWEVELGVVLGAPVRGADAAAAEAAIAGYVVANDISMRDWQLRTSQWLQGKSFEASTPVGPWLVTPDEVDAAGDLEISCAVDATVMQRSRTSDLVFSPVEIIAYISQFTTLRPGDLILTGTPGGVGLARDPQLYLQPGQVVTARIERLGQLRTRCVLAQ